MRTRDNLMWAVGLAPVPEDLKYSTENRRWNRAVLLWIVIGGGVLIMLCGLGIYGALTN